MQIHLGSGELLAKKKAHRKALKEKNCRELVRNELSTRLNKGFAPRMERAEAAAAAAEQQIEGLKAMIEEKQDR